MGNAGKLTFGRGNAKLGRDVYTFSLPAGHTCPGALKCLSSADRRTGRITDGPETEFRCYAATMEAQWKNVRDARWHNYTLLEKAAAKYSGQGHVKVASSMAALLLRSLPEKAKVIRIHVSGDFYRPEYLDAWIMAAGMRPGTLFYGYTKTVSLFISGGEPRQLPANMRITASLGGRQDHLIGKAGLKTVRVVYSQDDAAEYGLETDHDDTMAMEAGDNFALLLHGTQPAGTEAARALKELRAKGWTGYSEKR